MSQSSTEHPHTQSDGTTTKISEITRLPEFEKDLKALKKRFRTLDEDLKNFESSALKPFHEQGVEAGAVEHISGLGITETKIFKVVKFASRSLKGKGNRSGIRIVYAFHEVIRKIEFVEIYYKGDKESEDRERIKRYYGTGKIREDVAVYEAEHE